MQNDSYILQTETSAPAKTTELHFKTTVFAKGAEINCKHSLFGLTKIYNSMLSFLSEVRFFQFSQKEINILTDILLIEWIINLRSLKMEIDRTDYKEDGNN